MHTDTPLNAPTYIMHTRHPSLQQCDLQPPQHPKPVTKVQMRCLLAFWTALGVPVVVALLLVVVLVTAVLVLLV